MLADRQRFGIAEDLAAIRDDGHIIGEEVAGVQVIAHRMQDCRGFSRVSFRSYENCLIINMELK